jgi:hypothetical protein
VSIVRGVINLREQPVEQVLVLIRTDTAEPSPREYSASSGTDGRFSVEVPITGTYRIEFLHGHCERLALKNIAVQKGEVIDLEVSLVPAKESTIELDSR